MIRYCKKCVQPDTRPGIYFKDGICGACLYEEEKKKICWDARLQELHNIAKWAKGNSEIYDCAIGVSGGKDSTFQALYARDVLKLRPLLVNSEPDGITEIGRHNVENLINLGFDTIKLRPNPQVMKKLMKRDFYKYLNPVKATEYSLYSSTYIVADKFDIPLIIQGENIAFTLGVRSTTLPASGNSFEVDKMITLSENWKSYAEGGVSEKDLFLLHYNREKLENKTKAIWLQYYSREWSPNNNLNFAIANGLRVRKHFSPGSIGTYSPCWQMDSDLVQMNQLLKYLKFGFGQCTDHACYDIRAGKLARDEAIELVKKYDGKCSEDYIRGFCDYIGITLNEFWRVADSFRGLMWKKNEKGDWILKTPIWEQESKSVYSN